MIPRPTERVRSALLSLLLAASALGAALRVLPPVAPEPTAWHRLQGSTGIASGEGPVFLLDADFFPRQCGRGRLGADGILRLYAYAGDDCRAGVAWLSPRLLPADLRVSWALVPAAERHRLRQLGGATLGHLHEVAWQTLQAPFFVTEYLPQIETLLAAALQQAAASPAVARALAQAGEHFDRARLEALLSGLTPVVEEKIRENRWRALGDLLPVLFDSEDPAWRDTALRVFGEVLADPRVRAHLNQTLPILLTDPQAMAVGQALAVAAGQALFADPRLAELAGRLVSDRRFLGMRPFGRDAQRLLTALPEGLLRMRHRWDHNPLATYVLRDQIRGRRGFLVLLLDAAQEQALAGANLPPAPVLHRMTP